MMNKKIYGLLGTMLLASTCGLHGMLKDIVPNIGKMGFKNFSKLQTLFLKGGSFDDFNEPWIGYKPDPSRKSEKKKDKLEDHISYFIDKKKKTITIPFPKEVSNPLVTLTANAEETLFVFTQRHVGKYYGSSVLYIYSLENGSFIKSIDLSRLVRNGFAQTISYDFITTIFFAPGDNEHLFCIVADDPGSHLLLIDLKKEKITQHIAFPDHCPSNVLIGNSKIGLFALFDQFISKGNCAMHATHIFKYESSKFKHIDTCAEFCLTFVDFFSERETALYHLKQAEKELEKT